MRGLTKTVAAGLLGQFEGEWRTLQRVADTLGVAPVDVALGIGLAAWVLAFRIF